MEKITPKDNNKQGDAEKFLSRIGKKIDELAKHLPDSAEKAKHQVDQGIEDLRNAKELLERELDRLKTGEVSEQEFETKFGASLNDLKEVTQKIRNRFFEHNKKKEIHENEKKLLKEVYKETNVKEINPLKEEKETQKKETPRNQTLEEKKKLVKTKKETQAPSKRKAQKPAAKKISVETSEEDK